MFTFVEDLEVVTRGIDTIIPNTWNPNCMTSFQFEVLKGDITKNGLRYPIIITNDGVILDGEHRWRACQELGFTFISCFVSRIHQDQIEAQIVTITTNQLRGQFKDALLSDVLKNIQIQSPDLTIPDLSILLGFPERELENFVVDSSFLKEVEDSLEQVEEPKKEPMKQPSRSITFTFSTEEEYTYAKSYFKDDSGRKVIDTQKLLKLINY